VLGTGLGLKSPHFKFAGGCCQHVEDLSISLFTWRF